ncbi:LytTR family DNA-binding domain-containing protein [Pollutibacter soli]|uniref:LytR/AlgR family response regulator transcription factor n=1 Tax=Pollutibacter soli TaxID=3034157 RepID=UPI003013661A
MKVVIIEDETPAADKLQKAIQKTDKAPEVIAILQSVHAAVQWFSENPAPDLIFMDIELTDGHSFSIFEKVNITCPIIFITAYDDYWQTAFEYNSIDYLLKPLKQEKLEAALQKYDKLKRHFNDNFQQLMKYRGDTQEPVLKKRMLVKKGSDYVSVIISDIAYFYATHKLICLVDKEGRKFILDQSLSEIEKQVDPALFYRVNRKYLVNMNAIKRIRTYPKSKLLLEIDPPIEEEIIISQENVMAFKEWMDR